MLSCIRYASQDLSPNRVTLRLSLVVKKVLTQMEFWQFFNSPTHSPKHRRTSKALLTSQNAQSPTHTRSPRYCHDHRLRSKHQNYQHPRNTIYLFLGFQSCSNSASSINNAHTSLYAKNKTRSWRYNGFQWTKSNAGVYGRFDGRENWHIDCHLWSLAYEELGCREWHRNRADNLIEAIRGDGMFRVQKPEMMAG